MRYLECQHEVHGFGNYTSILIKSELWDYIIVDNYDCFKNVPDEKKILKDKFTSIIPNLTRNDIVHFPANFINDCYYENLKKSECKKIITLHDTIPLVIRTSLFNAYKWRRDIQRTLEITDYILTISENSKKDIIRFFNFPESKIRVVYQCSSKENLCAPLSQEVYLKEREKLRIPKENGIILCQANLRKHKNFYRMARAIKRSGLLDSYNIITLSKKDTPVFRFILRILGIKDNTIVPGYISDEEVCIIYGMAATLYEGFGMPVLEAMKCGTAVVTSDTNCAHELFEDAVYYVDPYNVDSISRGITYILEKEHNQEFSAKGLYYARRYSKDKYAEQMKVILSELENDCK